MRVAIVCYPTFGGSGVVATELGLALAQRGHEVHLVSYEVPFRVGDRWLPNLFFHVVESASYPLFRHGLYTLTLTNKLVELVEEHGVSLIHSHYAIPHAASAWMAREVLRSRGREVGLACTLHGTDITLVGRERGFFEMTRFAIDRQDLLTVPSRWLAEQTQAHFGIASERICVVPNCVDLTRFCPGDGAEVRRSIGAEGLPLLVHASNFRPVKRVEDVVRGFAVLRRQMPAVLALVGEGPDLPKAEQLARELGVREDLRLLGNHQAIENILQAADLFLLPSDAESFGLVALEAMACGCPVIGYQAGGLPEVVRSGVSGVLCPIGTDSCLGKVAAELLTDPERLRAMRSAARSAAESFAPGPVIDRYEALLAGVAVPAAALRAGH